MKIFLIGYMASGKSRLGRELAGLTGYDFLDLDDIFEQQYLISIYDFFEKYGEDVFRKMEKKILESTSNMDNTVIATGGGTPCFFDNMEFIRSNGISIYLKISPEALAGRLIEVKRKRPLIRAIDLPEMIEFVKEQICEREPFYKRAEYIIEEPGDLLEKIKNIPGIAEIIPLV
ncbi:MAG: shikimate kinase [Bacteroidota bacterium]|nr:shikimate kinase [Bacteroidota bacterium]